MKLHGKVAVVTGGLRGIGHAIALAMAQEGADLLIAGLSMDRAAQTEQEIRTLGRRCVVVRADVADEEAVKDMMARTVQHFGGLDILVNNAGIALFKPIDELTAAEFARQVGIEQTTAGNRLVSLHKKGYLQRVERPHPIGDLFMDPRSIRFAQGRLK